MLPERISFLFFILLSFTLSIQAQRDSIFNIEDYISQDAIEDFVADGDVNFEYDAIVDALRVLYKNPLNLNKATKDDLLLLPLLSPTQVDALIAHRAKFGDLISLYELQVVPGFSVELIRAIQPFIKLSKDLDDYNLGLGKMVLQGDNEILTRWSYFFPTGSFYEGTDGAEPRFEGNPYRYYFRYRHSYSNKLSYGITGEKDRGEAFFRGSNPQGFDFYSAHFFLRDYNKWLKSLALGDFRLSLGQGLIFYAGFGTRKGSQVTQIKRAASGITAFRSVDENNYLRGAGTEINITDKISVLAFGSLRNRDGNQVLTDSLDQEALEVSSLQSSGLHRSASEIEDEKSVQQFTTGGSVKYETPVFKVAANLVYNQLSAPLRLNEKPYNQFNFQGDEITNASIDYKYQFRNINIFGEWAISSNGGRAYTNGALINLNRVTDLAIINRNFGRDYQSLNPAPFAETGNANNERGTYVALEMKPNQHWIFSGYYDLYKFNWLRFQRDSPSSGRDFRGRVTFKIKRKLETYVEFRTETQSSNQRDNDTPFNFLVAGTRTQARLNFVHNISNGIKWKSRIDWGFFDVENADKEFGTAVYQDFIFQPSAFPLHFTTRFSLFDTESFNVRFYNYENSVLNTFYIPPYFGKGMRYYINLRYRGIRNVTLEARFAQTYYPDAFALIGTDGLILDNNRKEITLQVKLKW